MWILHTYFPSDNNLWLQLTTQNIAWLKVNYFPSKNADLVSLHPMTQRQCPRERRCKDNGLLNKTKGIISGLHDFSCKRFSPIVCIMGISCSHIRSKLKTFQSYRRASVRSKQLDCNPITVNAIVGVGE
jgi:hypothetical protein